MLLALFYGPGGYEAGSLAFAAFLGSPLVVGITVVVVRRWVDRARRSRLRSILGGAWRGAMVGSGFVTLVALVLAVVVRLKYDVGALTDFYLSAAVVLVVLEGLLGTYIGAIAGVLAPKPRM